MSLPLPVSLALVRTLELKDPLTAAHTWRVVLYTRALAERCGVDHAMVARLSTAAALHDLGKVDVPDEILNKPGPLTDAERAVMQTHAAKGHERLVAMGETDPLILELVRHHHERPDGRGYPDGVGGKELPIAARYFAVVDSFDALTSVRPYRAQIGHDAGVRAIEALRAEAGTRYDRDAVEAFAELFNTGELEWILQHFNDRCELPAYDGFARADEMQRFRAGAKS